MSTVIGTESLFAYCNGHLKSRQWQFMKLLENKKVVQFWNPTIFEMTRVIASAKKQGGNSALFLFGDALRLKAAAQSSARRC
jgi:hypothetical protein